jgi:2-dehydropantoate 2-reductase
LRRTPAPGALDGDERTAVVVGAGAIGLLLQYLLQGPAKSTLIARRASYERFQAAPLRFTGALDGTQYIRCQTWESVGKLDPLVSVFVATRARDVPGVLQTLKKRLAKHATVVLCQEGIGVFAAANEILPKTRLVRLASWLHAERWDLDHVNIAGLGRLELAGDPGDRVLLEHWQNVLSRPHLQTTVAFDPVALEWKKSLATIATDLLCALAHAKNGALLDEPELRAAASELIGETAGIAELEGVRLTSHDRAAVFQSLDTTRGCVNATLQDLRAGRKPELEFTNGAVVAAARKHGRKAPLNETLLALVAHLERMGRFRELTQLPGTEVERRNG